MFPLRQNVEGEHRPSRRPDLSARGGPLDAVPFAHGSHPTERHNSLTPGRLTSSAMRPCPYADEDCGGLGHYECEACFAFASEVGAGDTAIPGGMIARPATVTRR